MKLMILLNLKYDCSFEIYLMGDIFRTLEMQLTWQKTLTVRSNFTLKLYRLIKRMQCSFKTVGRPLKYYEHFICIGAQVFLDLEKFDQCIEDCELAIKLNPEGPKAYYRKGLALREL